MSTYFLAVSKYQLIFWQCWNFLGVGECQPAIVRVQGRVQARLAPLLIIKLFGTQNTSDDEEHTSQFWASLHVQSHTRALEPDNSPPTPGAPKVTGTPEKVQELNKDHGSKLIPRRPGSLFHINDLCHQPGSL